MCYLLYGDVGGSSCDALQTLFSRFLFEKVAFCAAGELRTLHGLYAGDQIMLNKMFGYYFEQSF